MGCFWKCALSMFKTVIWQLQFNMQHNRCYSLGHFQSLPSHVGSDGGWDMVQCCSMLIVLSFALIYSMLLFFIKLHIPAFFLYILKKLFKLSFWSMRGQTHMFIDLNYYCLLQWSFQTLILSLSVFRNFLSPYQAIKSVWLKENRDYVTKM